MSTTWERAVLEWLKPGTQSFGEFWNWANSVADPRVQNWPLLQSPEPTVYITLLYLAFVFVGRAVMKQKHRQPYDLKGAMIAYNVLVIGINVYMLQGFVLEAYRAEYKWICNPIDLSPRGLPIAWYVYVYYLSKVVDFTDTVFIILRKKFDQLSFLHVYHHSAMFLIWWIGSKWGSGGDAIFGPMCNSFIHIVMYTYYLAAALKIHIPGKKYLTLLQMVQFFTVVTHSGLIIALDCPFPHRFQYAQILFLCSLFALFLNFYFQTYHGRRARVKDEPHRGSTVRDSKKRE